MSTSLRRYKVIGYLFDLRSAQSVSAQISLNLHLELIIFNIEKSLRRCRDEFSDSSTGRNNDLIHEGGTYTKEVVNGIISISRDS